MVLIQRCWMDSLFFWISKLAWLLLTPDSVILILLVAAWALLRRGAYRSARRVLGLVVTAMILIATLPLGEWLLYPLERRFPANPVLPARVDGIIVLGGSEDAVRSAFWNQTELGESAERDLAFLMLARRYPDARLVFAGGSGSLARQEYKGADVAKRLFEEQGLDLARITFESRSRNTCENVKYTQALVRPTPDQTWILVTTAWHMPRSFGIFSKAGWVTIPYPVDHWTDSAHLLRVDLDLAGHLRDLTYGVKEWIGLAAYYATGRTSSLFPGAPASGGG
jgi:uncharacterized SAM-binding protein YcdF (DUF218 family)